jgi:hypothetical protein
MGDVRRRIESIEVRDPSSVARENKPGLNLSIAKVRGAVEKMLNNFVFEKP